MTWRSQQKLAKTLAASNHSGNVNPQNHHSSRNDSIRKGWPRKLKITARQTDANRTDKASLRSRNCGRERCSKKIRDVRNQRFDWENKVLRAREKGVQCNSFGKKDIILCEVTELRDKIYNM